MQKEIQEKQCKFLKMLHFDSPLRTLETCNLKHICSMKGILCMASLYT